MATTARRALLEEAADLVDGDRNAQYGDPRQDFQRTGIYWSTHILGVLHRKAHEQGITLTAEVEQILATIVDPHDVAIMMTQLKLSRLAWSPSKRDSYADGAGYLACGSECAELSGT